MHLLLYFILPLVVIAVLIRIALVVYPTRDKKHQPPERPDEIATITSVPTSSPSKGTSAHIATIQPLASQLQGKQPLNAELAQRQPAKQQVSSLQPTMQRMAQQQPHLVKINLIQPLAAQTAQDQQEVFHDIQLNPEHESHQVAKDPHLQSFSSLYRYHLAKGKIKRDAQLASTSLSAAVTLDTNTIPTVTATPDVKATAGINTTTNTVATTIPTPVDTSNSVVKQQSSQTLTTMD